MSDVSEALADIRRWACETLDASDAGKLCGMLSEVSWHANGLEAQNKRLRKWYTALRESQKKAFARACESATNDALKFGKLSDDNAKLRELVRDMWRDGMCDCDEYHCAHGEYHCAQCEYHFPDRMRELGIEVGDD